MATSDDPAPRPSPRSRTRALAVRLPPGPRRRARQLADAVLAGALGSWDRATVADRMALTLDDGPDDIVTPLMLSTLAAADVHATFFVLTLRAERRPDLLRAIADGGHEIALHGLDHRRVSDIPGGQIDEYLNGARDRLEQVSGTAVTLFRPPYGAHSVRSARAAARAGLRVVVWNGDAADWEDRPADDVLAAADRATTPGGILLFHERLEPDPRHPDPERSAPVTTFDRPDVVARLIPRLRARGLEPGTVGALRDAGPMHRTAWLRG